MKLNRKKMLVAGLVLAAGASLSAERAEAQSRWLASVDGAFGWAYGMGGEFVDRRLNASRLAASIGRWRANNTGVFGELSADWELMTGHKLSCRLNAANRCIKWYPEFGGPSVVLGMARRRADGAIETRAGIGGAAYRADTTNVGALLAQADGMVALTRHVGFTAGVRWVFVPRYHGESLSIFPIMIGLRVRNF